MDQRLSPRRRAYDLGLRLCMIFCAGVTCALLIFLIGYIFCRGLPNLTWDLLSGQTSYIQNTIGILPNILNTLYIIFVAMVIVLPLGVGAAVYLTEYAENRRLVSLIEFAAETLTGIPSIIFGLVGMLLFVQKMNLQAGILAGGLTLVVMILPTILRTTQESLKTVPQSYREGALGLGAGKWRMIRTVVLPNAIDGIVTGCILAVGRIVGESAALLYTAGFGLVLSGFVQGAAHLLRHADGGAVRLRQRAGRNGGGLFHRLHPDAADPAHQPFRRPAGPEAEKELRISMEPILDVKNLNLWYGQTHALRDVSIAIPPHEITAFIGPSGCGKSTFLRTLNRMNDLIPSVRITGEVNFHGQNIYDGAVDPTWLRKRIGMVFQKANPFPMSIYDNVAYGPRTHGIRSRAKLDELVERSLRSAAIWDEVKDRLKKSALGLSGGQQQRLCIARALAVEPEILLMDESTSALDPISTSKIEDLAVELKKDYTVVMVTHNMQQAARVSDNTAFFLLGELVEFGKTERLFSTPSDKRTEDYITGRFG